MRQVILGEDPLRPLEQRGGLSEEEFRRARSLVLQVSGAFGSAGPPGDSEESRSFQLPEELGFFVVDDFYGVERVVIVEPKLELLSPEWVDALSRALKREPGWEVQVLTGGGIELWISESAIRTSGWTPSSLELCAVLAEIRRVVESLERKRESTSTERLAQVQRLLLARVPVEISDDVVFVASFQHRSDGSLGDSVWLIHRQEASQLDLDDLDVTPSAVYPSLFWVRQDATLVEYAGAVSRPNDATGLLVEWCLRRGTAPLSGVRSFVVRRGDSRWEFPVTQH